MWLVITSEGVRPGGVYKVGGNGMTVSRTYRNTAGDAIDLAKGSIDLGEVVYVEIEVAKHDRCVDPEHRARRSAARRLRGREPAPGPRIQSRLDRARRPVDARLHEHARRPPRGVRLARSGQSKKVVYTVRAVTSGTYTVPPVDVEAMYDPTLWAREAGGKAVIGGPWTGKLL
jgi:uncharacterized protein YfaS (alpha-2-macroglobulin family)